MHSTLSVMVFRAEVSVAAVQQLRHDDRVALGSGAMQQVLTSVKPQSVGTELALDEIAETVLKSGVGVATIIVYHLVEAMNHLNIG